jgi:hypothetical protein
MLHALLIAGALIAPPNSTEDSLKHALTGAAIGASVAGVCDDVTDEAQPLTCFVLSEIALLAGYGVKECVYDAQKYNGGDCDGRDFLQGVIPGTVAATVHWSF